uniref:Uncharacterized protein n=1 Tax=Romanomermis culicivorax TaxID=13658 RepID=A0A915IW50_ROMCU
MSGVLDDSLSIWLSSITSGVNFLATFLGMYLISKISRRILLLSSISGVILTLLLLSLSFFLIECESDQSAIIGQDENFNNQDACSNYSR